MINMHYPNVFRIKLDLFAPIKLIFPPQEQCLTYKNPEPFSLKKQTM